MPGLAAVAVAAGASINGHASTASEDELSSRHGRRPPDAFVAESAWSSRSVAEAATRSFVVCCIGPRTGKNWPRTRSTRAEADQAQLTEAHNRLKGYVPKYVPKYLPNRVPKYLKSSAEVQRIIDDVERANEKPDPFSRTVSLNEAICQIHDKCRGLSTVDVIQHLPLTEEAVAILEEMRQERQPHGHINSGLLSQWCSWERYGMPRHVRARGPEPIPVKTLFKPTAEEFWPYVLRNQPVIIKGALDPEGFPPLVDFQDTEYLRSRCGFRKVLVKADHFLDDQGRPCYITDPSLEMLFEEFLSMMDEALENDDAPYCFMGKSKLTEVLPELVEDIIDLSPNGPIQQFGSAFGTCKDGPHMYFGCARNTTSLHSDPSDNLAIVISGTKTFDVYPPTDADCLYLLGVPSFMNSGVPPFTDPDNMPEDLAEKFPLYRYARPQRVELVAGDIFYLPIFWFHCVTGSTDRNMIIPQWFQLHPDKLDISPANEGAQAIVADVMRLQG